MSGIPLTGAQAGVWHAQKLDPDSPVYNVAAFVEIGGPGLDADRLAAAVTAAECLHVRFTEEDGGCRQHAVSLADWAPRVLDLRSEQELRAAALAWMANERLRPVDAVTDPDRRIRP